MLSVKKIAEKMLNEDLSKDIKKTKEKLIKAWKRKGAYENFGQKEIRGLKDKYGSGGANMKALKQIDALDDWAGDYTGE